MNCLSERQLHYIHIFIKKIIFKTFLKKNTILQKPCLLSSKSFHKLLLPAFLARVRCLKQLENFDIEPQFVMFLHLVNQYSKKLSNPIYQADRCSINFHPLHSYYAIALYFIMSFFRKPFNIIGIGLVLHMISDFTDCFI